MTETLEQRVKGDREHELRGLYWTRSNWKAERERLLEEGNTEQEIGEAFDRLNSRIHHLRRLKFTK